MDTNDFEAPNQGEFTEKQAKEGKSRPAVMRTEGSRPERNANLREHEMKRPFDLSSQVQEQEGESRKRFHAPGSWFYCLDSVPYTKCARRFCCQQASLWSVQNGRSLP